MNKPETNNTRKKPLSKDKKIKIQKTYLNIKTNSFFIVLLLIAVIGLLLPLRPTESVVEKRELEKFPKFTLSSFWDGSFFNQISTWYADTFPFRESLMSANADFKCLYGIQGEQIVSNTDKTGDEIPEGGSIVIATKAETEDESESAETTRGSDAQTDDTAEETIETEEETYEDGAIHDVPEIAGNVYVTGDTAFSIYYFVLDGANNYINMIDSVQKKLDGIATVYDILVPTSVGVCLDSEAQEKIGSQDQEKAMEYVLSNIESLNSNVKTVRTYQALKNHNSEYIYFRTDHHWTALGAYYAYKEFCKVKGITPHDLSSFQTMEFDNFVGTFYASSGQVAALKNNPDTVVAYVPNGTNQMMFIDANLQENPWYIVNDVSTWNSGSKYSTFAGADQPYAQIDNPAITDGSSCVVIKESFGNAFIPFLVDHYQHIYIIDYRYFYKYPRYNNNLTQLIKENNVQDVIFINNAEAMESNDKIKQMSSMFE